MSTLLARKVSMSKKKISLISWSEQIARGPEFEQKGELLHLENTVRGASPTKDTDCSYGVTRLR